MKSHDFDKEIQSIINGICSTIPKVDWRKWLDASTKGEYLDLALKLSGLDQVEDLLLRLRKEKTENQNFSVKINEFTGVTKEGELPIFTHTSGTTNNDLNALKWFFIAPDLIKKLWAPGMQAIFESSGLDQKSSAIIFVPSRLNLDGIRQIKNKTYISLYSSEFSQRIMLGIIKPKSYLLYPYKDALNLDVITKILSLDNVSIVSAPAATIFKWADYSRFYNGVKNQQKNLKIAFDNESEEDAYNTSNLNGIQKDLKDLQQKLSLKLSKATLIFSITSITPDQWNILRNFMHWTKNGEKFTNLYVASEIGPFAASIFHEDKKVINKKDMFVLPLTLPIVENKGEKELISFSNRKQGILLVSRMNAGKELININTGDLITIKNQEGLPQIDGKIIREGFPLKYDINISERVDKPKNYQVYAGGFFSFKTLEIIDPSSLLDCLSLNCALEHDSMLIVRKKVSSPWILYLKLSENSSCNSSEKINDIIFNNCQKKTKYITIKDKQMEIMLLKESPINFPKKKNTIIKAVQNGQLPKGTLKKWPLYLVIPNTISIDKDI